MPELLSTAPNVTTLRERLNRFLANDAEWKSPLRHALRRIADNSCTGVIFGGVLRDLTFVGGSEVPRDVDVVVDAITSDDLQSVFADLVYEKNRFGGLRLRTRGWMIDIWALNDTWAFREKLKEQVSFESLVQ